MKVSVVILTYNAIQYLDDCLKSIFKQTFRDFKILVVDNASDDGTVERIKRDYPEVTVLQNFKNLGLAKGYNQGIKFWPSEYVLVVNQDVILQPDFLSKLVAAADQQPRAGSLTGKILKLSLFAEDKKEKELGPEIIDTAGLAGSKSRRFYDRGAGEPDKGQYDQPGEIFGASGALALYRRSALEAVKLKNLRQRQGYKFTTDFDYYEYFDEDYFMYKEDVDLAWRLQLAGWSGYYLPSAEAYHYRTGSGLARFGNWQTLRDRRRKSRFVNQLSYKNHLLTLVKNEQWSNFFRHGPWLLAYELKKLLFVLCWEVGSWSAGTQFLRLLPSAVAKRRQVRRLTQVSPQAMRRWFI